MKKYAIVFLLTIVAAGINAQNQKTAIVTNVNYFIQQSTFISSLYFPFYLNKSELVQDIQNEITKQAKIKFKADTVIFIHHGSVIYSEGYTAPDLLAKETAKQRGKKDHVYIEVLSILRERIFIDGDAVFGLTTKIKAYNHKGKSVYRYKNVIPFQAQSREEITGDVILGEDDFSRFYIDGITAAFGGGINKFEKQLIQKPPIDYYDAFIAESETFYISETRSGYNYGADKKSPKEVLSFKNNFWKSHDAGSLFLDILDNNRVKDGFNITNHFQKNEYLVQMKGSHKELFNFFSSSVPIEVSFMNR